MKRLTVTCLFTLSFLALFSALGCAYNLSNKIDSLPGNVRSIYVPVFKNITSEAGAEVFFTDAIKTEILRSGYASIKNSEEESDAVLIGTIKSIEILEESLQEAFKTSYLPAGTIISTTMKARVVVLIVMRLKSSKEILWSSEFTQEKNYSPPQIHLPVLNTANNLYNLTAKRQTLATISNEMMQLAFDRLVDNF